MTPTLQLDPEQVRRTLEPLERASMLPPAAFTDERVLDWELASVFGREWICAAHISAVAEPGAWVMREVGDQSFFVIGGKDGRPRAFHNVCRHRGARIFEEDQGKARARITCPYHAWSYGFDGELLGARATEGLEDFDPSCFGLVPLRTDVVGGLVMVDLDGGEDSAAEVVGELAGWLEHFHTADLAPGGERTYEVEANWKAIAENYNECLHCPGVHPELNALSAYDSGDEIEGAGAWCGGSMTLNEGAETMAVDGGHAVRPPIAGLTPEDLNSVYYFALFPNALVSLHPDYVMLHTLWPRSAGRTTVTCEWLFEPDTIRAEGFDPSDAIDFWDQVNREDWHVCELTQKGSRSQGYTPGRYTTHETDVHAFDKMVADRYLAGLASNGGPASTE
jgi:Rieske 2Fe-2S family protein